MPLHVICSSQKRSNSAADDDEDDDLFDPFGGVPMRGIFRAPQEMPSHPSAEPERSDPVGQPSWESSFGRFENENKHTSLPKVCKHFLYIYVSIDFYVNR